MVPEEKMARARKRDTLTHNYVPHMTKSARQKVAMCLYKGRKDTQQNGVGILITGAKGNERCGRSLVVMNANSRLPEVERRLQQARHARLGVEVIDGVQEHVQRRRACAAPEWSREF